VPGLFPLPAALKKINSILLFLACVVLVLSIIIAVLNMTLRPFGHPITGSFELMGYGSALVTALGLGFSQEKKSHIAVDILFKRFPPNLKKWFNFTGLLVSGLFFAAVAWRLFAFALDLRANEELSETLMLPFYPVTMVVSMGLLVLTANLLWDAVRIFRPATRQGPAD